MVLWRYCSCSPEKVNREHMEANGAEVHLDRFRPDYLGWKLMGRLLSHARWSGGFAAG
jgi:hypothetical protein